MRHRNLFSIVLTAALMGLAAIAQAAGTWYVATGGSDANDGSSGAPFATIEHAIVTAAAGDTINVAAGTYGESLWWSNKDLTIHGAGSVIDPTTGSSPGLGCLSTYGLSAASSIDGFAFVHGSSGVGGGIFNSQSSLYITNCTFSENTAFAGGGIYNDAGTVAVVNCTFSDNNADNYWGGGIYSGAGTVAVVNCTFSDNNAGDGGGGIYSSVSTLTVYDCFFGRNSSAGAGGGIYSDAYTSQNVVNCTFSANSSVNSGGAIFNGSSLSNVDNCIFRGNHAGDLGGGMSNFGASPTVASCLFRENSADNGGGGMANQSLGNGVPSRPIVTNCAFEGNASQFGGGIANLGVRHSSGYDVLANAVVTDCTFSMDFSWSIGGSGIANVLANPTVTNCTFCYNPEGIWNVNFWDGTPSRPIVTNSIFWHNWVGINGGNPTITFTDLQDLSNTTPDANGNFMADPMFVRNANWTGDYDYGDLRLLPSSPCIDKGTNRVVISPPFLTVGPAPGLGLIVDLDGNPRIVDANGDGIATVDMGAYEDQPQASKLVAANIKGGLCANVNLKATLTSGGAAVAGRTVHFSVDGVEVGTGVTGSTGIALFKYQIPSSAALGAHAVHAAFTGDGAYAANSADSTLTVGQGTPALSLKAVSGTAGSTVTLTATLKNGCKEALAGRTLSFSVNGGVVGSAVTNASGVATIPYTIPAGTVSGTIIPDSVSFAGDALYLAKTVSSKITVL